MTSPSVSDALSRRPDAAWSTAAWRRGRGKHEAIAIGPDRDRGIVLQKFLPKRIGHRRQGHGRAGVAGIGFLHSIDGKVRMVLMHSWSILCWLSLCDCSCAGRWAPAVTTGFRCTGDMRRVREFYVNLGCRMQNNADSWRSRVGGQ